MSPNIHCHPRENITGWLNITKTSFEEIFVVAKGRAKLLAGGWWPTFNLAIFMANFTSTFHILFPLSHKIHEQFILFMINMTYVYLIIYNYLNLSWNVISAWFQSDLWFLLLHLLIIKSECDPQRLSVENKINETRLISLIHYCKKT